eukprot:scaffold129586_cov63-Phaeocystis_antarctica.AAC.3
MGGATPKACALWCCAWRADFACGTSWADTRLPRCVPNGARLLSGPERWRLLRLLPLDRRSQTWDRHQRRRHSMSCPAMAST